MQRNVENIKCIAIVEANKYIEILNPKSLISLKIFATFRNNAVEKYALNSSVNYLFKYIKKYFLTEAYDI